MSNPKEKHFLVVTSMDGVEILNFQKYIENDLGKEAYDSKQEKLVNPKYYIHWYRDFAAKFYILATLEDTIWTVDKITSNIQKNVKGAHSFLVVDVHDAPCQGLMDVKFWNFLKEIKDLTKFINDLRRSKKLRKIKSLLDKKEELKRKAEILKQKEIDLLKKKDMINEEAELIKKENELRMMKAELDEQQKDLTKLKDDSETPLNEEPSKKRKRIFGWF